MKSILIIFCLGILLSCTTTATTNSNTSRDIVNITIFNSENNESITFELDVIELRLTTYEDNWSEPRVYIETKETDLLNMETSIYRSSIKINEKLISDSLNGTSRISLSGDDIGTFVISYKISNEIIDYIKTLQTIKITEEFRKNTWNITSFENKGSLNNLLTLNNNYISTLYKFMNTKLTDIIIFAGNNRLEYEFDNENEYITYVHIYLSRYSYLSLGFDKKSLGSSYPEIINFVFDGNRFNTLLPQLLEELGDPNGYTRNFANDHVAWTFKELFVYFLFKENFTMITIIKRGQ